MRRRPAGVGIRGIRATARALFRLSLLLVLAFAPPALATDYYLHPNGSDGAAGTSPASAWRTLAHAIPLLMPGDTLSLAGNASLPYEGQAGVEIDVSGAPGPGGRITIRNQPGHTPVVSGTQRFDSGWDVHAGQIYVQDLLPPDFAAEFRPLLVFQNPKGEVGGDFLSNPPDPVASLAEMAPGRWFHEITGTGNRLYVWVNDLGAGSDPNAYTIEVGKQISALGDVDPPFASHLVFEGIEFRGYTGVSQASPLDVGGPGAITFLNAAAISATSDRRDIRFRSCSFRQNWKGLRMGAVHDLVIEDSLFSENVAGGVSVGLTTSPDPQTGFLMSNSIISDTYGPWPAKSVADSNPAAIKVHKLAGGAIRGTRIERTHVNRAGDYAPHGIWTDVDVTDFTIEDNIVRDVEGTGSNFSGRAIFIERRANRNLVRRNLVVNAQQGIVLGSKAQPQSDWPQAAVVHNNTIVDSVYNGIHVIAAVDPELYNNIVVGTGHTPIRIDSSSLTAGTIWVEANASWDATPPGPGLFYGVGSVWNDPPNKTAAGLSAEPGVSGLVQELNADPRLANPGGGDYSLRASSPAIDAGLPTGEPFRGAGVDLGYLESALSVPSLPLAGSLLLGAALVALGARRAQRA